LESPDADGSPTGCANDQVPGVFERYEASEVNQIDAAALLGITERIPPVVRALRRRR
jgi:hypothetical protein